MNPLLVVNALLFSLREESLQVLVKNQPGGSNLPEAPLGRGELLEQAVSRLIASLSDRGASHLEQLYTYGEAGQPVRVVYFALVGADSRPPAGAGVRWRPVGGLEGLLGKEADILAYALRRLRYKLEYSAVGFHLLPGEFTLSELQHTYEIILGEALDKRNFRRRMLHSGIIEATPHLRSGEGRPARLYRYIADAVAEVKARRLFP